MHNNFSNTLVEEYNLFGRVFPHHDELQQSIANEMEKFFLNKKPSDQLSFLDIGAGYGFTTGLVAEKFPDAHYILNEYDSQLLDQSNTFLKDYDIEKQIGDIELIIKNIPDNSLDAVYTAWVLHNFPPEKRSVVYAEISRVLKPGGVFVALEKVGNPGEQRLKDLSQSIINFIPFYTEYNRPDLFIEWVNHNLRDEEPNLLFSDSENDSLLKQNGFTWKYVKHILLEKVFVAQKNLS